MPVVPFSELESSETASAPPYNSAAHLSKGGFKVAGVSSTLAIMRRLGTRPAGARLGLDGQGAADPKQNREKNQPQADRISLREG